MKGYMEGWQGEMGNSISYVKNYYKGKIKTQVCYQTGHQREAGLHESYVIPKENTKIKKQKL